MPDAPSAECTLQGLPASPGMALGNAVCFQRTDGLPQPQALAPEQVAAELGRLQDALTRSRRELLKIKETADERVGRSASAIFDAQLLMLDDVALLADIEREIRTARIDAENATARAFGRLESALTDANDPVLRERAGDVADLRLRVVRNLQAHRLMSRFDGEAVVIADTLSAADTIVLARNRVLAFVMESGGLTSHAVILARSLGIPAVIACHGALDGARPGAVVLVDGDTGAVVIDPTPATRAHFEQQLTRRRQVTEHLGQIAQLPAVTRDGYAVSLEANVDRLEDTGVVRQSGATGIGLVRTEHLLTGQGFPSEEEQTHFYRTLAERMHPHWVTLRAFDIGADKPFLPLQLREPNPALGCRGIRLLLTREDVFRTQLRAVLRASAHRNVRLMLPMVTRIEEVRRARDLIDLVKQELRREEAPFDEHLPVGVMVEVPGAALLAHELAYEADFLSIGTNDLVQYTLAVDRTNDALTHLYEEFHPAVIRLIHDVVEAAHREETPVAVCGELAGNPLATVLLVGLGIDGLSVAPPRLLPVKQAIRTLTRTEAERVARAVLGMRSADQVRALLTEWRTDNERSQTSATF